MYIYNKFQFNDLGLQTQFRAVKVGLNTALPVINSNSRDGMCFNQKT